MKNMEVFTSLLLGIVLTTNAGDLAIQSFSNRTGQLTFNELATATTYRVDWANSPTGIWHTAYPGAMNLTARGYGQCVVTVGVANATCFYRVLASVTNGLPPGPTSDYLVVDVSGGTNASSYPVSYLSAVPNGDWTDEYKTGKIVFRRIPANNFTMGSPTSERGRQSDETQHLVVLSQTFCMGVFEITQRQWELVMGNKPSFFNNPAYYQTRPAEQVKYTDIRGASAGGNWPATNTVDASSFMGVLRAKTGKVFDLPTESQWEYACRAGTTTALNSGYDLTSTSQDAHMDQVGRYWVNGLIGYTKNGDTTAGTAKVGSYKPNAWGLYDMHVNVLEWCLDWYAYTYPGTVTDPKGPLGSYRVSRGGDWSTTARCCRSAFRGYGYPDDTSNCTGLRVCYLPTSQ